MPQLLNPIDEAEVRKLIANPFWLMQEKMDGRRLLIRKAAQNVEAVQPQGAVRWPVKGRRESRALSTLRCGSGRRS